MHSRSLRTVLGMTLAQLAGAAWLVAGASAPAAAQAAQEQPPQRQQAPASQSSSAVTSAQVPDQELEAFVKSVAQVNEVRKSLNDQPAGGQQAKDQANQKMATIIQACGMNVDRYNELKGAMSSDPQLSQRFQATQKELADKHDLTCGSNNSGDKH